MSVKLRSVLSRGALVAAAMSTAALAPAPAFAGGRDRYYDNYGRHYDYSYRNDYGRHRGYSDYRHRRRGHISAGEGALIAAGIIGGVILIDRALDSGNRSGDRRYDDRRYDDRRYDGRYDRGYDDRRDRRGAIDDDYYYQRDDRPYDDRPRGGRDEDYRSAGSDRDIDDILLGDDDRRLDSRADLRAIPADAAFRECVAETRGAAGAGGMSVAMPGAPTEVERLADGSVRMTAQFRASNPRGESWTRRFVCEADDQGVRFLQVD